MKKHLFLTIVLLGVFLVSGCGTNSSPSAPVDAGPTVDPNLVFTSGAQTVVAQITLDAANNPVPTAALPVTATVEAATPDPAAALPTFPALEGTTPGAPLPTAAPLAGVAVTQPADASAAAGLPTAAAALPTVAPAAPAGTVVAAIPDKLQWVSNVPADKSKVPAGKGFKITWKLQNEGTTTWDATYNFKF